MDCGDHIGLVARRNDRDDRRPAAGGFSGVGAIVARARAAPEIAMRRAADRARRQATASAMSSGQAHRRYPAWRNQAMASARPSREGPGAIAQLALRLGRGEDHMVLRHAQAIEGDEGLAPGEAGDRLGQSPRRDRSPRAGMRKTRRRAGRPGGRSRPACGPASRSRRREYRARRSCRARAPPDGPRPHRRHGPD